MAPATDPAATGGLEPTNLPDSLKPQPENAPLQANVQNATDGAPLSFDPEALKKKYLLERDKRLRNHVGPEQYRRIENEHEHLLADPYSKAPTAREPIRSECDVVVIGGGYGGQLVAVRLQQQGFTNICIIEKAADFGGTWYWNRYPGAQCDVESYVYMPLLDETGYVPTWKYAGGEELQAYARKIGEFYGLYEKAIFQTEVQTLDWQESASRWRVGTDRGDEILTKFVVPVSGPLHQPKLPGIPGLGSFKGHTFHTTRWDYAYTGGDVNGNLTGLADKRIGVIGTGATAVQIVPHLGKAAKELIVFQRTPSSIDVRGNKPTDPEWVQSLGEHWQRKRMDNFNIIVNGGKQDEDLVSDGWTDILRRLTGRASENANANAKMDIHQLAERRQLLDFEKMEQIRNRVSSVVRDPSTAEALKPYYNQFCKRPCFHDDYLPTFNLSSVKLVHTDGRGVDAITANGIVANDTEYELDCIIFATGFEHATSWGQKSGITVRGRSGQTLDDKWADGPSTLHGLTTRDFPNCFFVQVTQAALSPNFLHIIDFQAKLIAYVLQKCEAEGIRTVEPTQEAEDAWVQTIIDSGSRRRITAKNARRVIITTRANSH